MLTLITSGCISPEKGPVREYRPWGGCLPAPKAYGFPKTGAGNGRAEAAPYISFIRYRRRASGPSDPPGAR